jgi:hypothetical protein
VVAAVGAGFGGALVLTSTTPVHKEQPMGFAKRDPAIQAPKVVATAEAAVPAADVSEAVPTPAPVASTPVPLPVARGEIKTPPAKNAEEVAALTFVPLQTSETASQAESKPVKSDPVPQRVGSVTDQTAAEAGSKTKVVTKTERQRRAPAYRPEARQANAERAQTGRARAKV